MSTFNVILSKEQEQELFKLVSQHNRDFEEPDNKLVYFNSEILDDKQSVTVEYTRSIQLFNFGTYVSEATKIAKANDKT